MSLDVLPFVSDKAAAVGEVARILRPGSRFAFTIWEHLGGLAAADADRAALAGTFQAHPWSSPPTSTTAAFWRTPDSPWRSTRNRLLAQTALGPGGRHHRRHARGNPQNGASLPGHGTCLRTRPADDSVCARGRPTPPFPGRRRAAVRFRRLVPRLLPSGCGCTWLAGGCCTWSVRGQQAANPVLRIGP